MCVVMQAEPAAGLQQGAPRSPCAEGPPAAVARCQQQQQQLQELQLPVGGADS
jgi:hypothetical protein